MNTMLCQSATPEQARMLGDEWIIERKFDGVRAYIENGKLYDRRNAEITKRFPEFTGLNAIKETIDGEIVLLNDAETDDFSAVASRMHLRDRFAINLMSKKMPCVFVAFDISHDGVGSIGQKMLSERRKQLESSTGKLGWDGKQKHDYFWLHLTEQFSITQFDALWDEVKEQGREGLIVKNTQSIYEGKRSANWLKVKAWVETTAEFIKLEGQPKGYTMETADGRRVVVNGSQADKVHDEFVKHDKVTAHIQYLPQNNSSEWRFPSFRGLVKQDNGQGETE